MMINAVIMAAGFSRRMGRKKLLLDIDGKPIIEWVIDLVNNFDFEEKVLIYQDKEIKEIAEMKNIKMVYNPDSHIGMSSSVKIGTQNTREGGANIFFTGDQPFLTPRIVSDIIYAFYSGKGSIIVPRYKGKRGNPVLFGPKWRGQLLALDGDKGGRQIIDENLEEVFFLDFDDEKARFDIDTWEDYQRALKMK